MIEKTILLGSIDPIDIFGTQNHKMNRIAASFPKLKIIARDNTIKLMGETSAIEEFETRFALLIDYYTKYHTLSLDNINDLLTGAEASGFCPTDSDPSGVLVYGHNGKLIKARTDNQRLLVELQDKNDLVFATGPAGTGKTYTAVALAVRALKNKQVKRIILCRPAVEAEEKLGFIPGSLQDKLDPYLQPLYDALYDMIPGKKLEELMADKVIQVAPLAYMRGRTLDSAFVILDEAQNATIGQLKMFLTRMGENAKFIITGDLTQIDLPDKSKSGLETTLNMLREVEGIGMLHFQRKDIIRHRLVRDIVRIFDKQHSL